MNESIVDSARKVIDQSPSSRFDERFRSKLVELLEMRRDVRHFLQEPLPEGVVQKLVTLACLAPSVGYSQPWRWVQVRSTERRSAILANFRRCNAQALGAFAGEQAALYARLKLAGLVEAPVQLAVFIDEHTDTGHGLGVKTMPEMLAYSAVCAVNTFWLAARAEGIGIGWVSILDAEEVRQTLEVPAEWKLIAYLCLGYAREERERPELESEGWESRRTSSDIVLDR